MSIVLSTLSKWKDLTYLANTCLWRNFQILPLLLQKTMIRLSLWCEIQGNHVETFQLWWVPNSVQCISPLDQTYIESTSISTYSKFLYHLHIYLQLINIQRSRNGIWHEIQPGKSTDSIIIFIRVIGTFAFAILLLLLFSFPSTSRLSTLILGIFFVPNTERNKVIPIYSS